FTPPPLCASLNIPIICSSLNLLFFIRSALLPSRTIFSICPFFGGQVRLPHCFQPFYVFMNPVSPNNYLVATCTRGTARSNLSRTLATVLVASVFPQSVLFAVINEEGKPTTTAPAKEIKRTNQEIYFTQDVGLPPYTPFLVIHFTGIPETNVDPIAKLRNYIEKRLPEYHGEKDVEKVMVIIREYLPKFLEADPHAIVVIFPKENKRIIVHQQRK
ncbi:MAG: hypothetical protein K8T91_15415, partial [Planctomycetes bacterium]|nr:hypothetical protein [Planctomycetota bacterium]